MQSKRRWLHEQGALRRTPHGGVCGGWRLTGSSSSAVPEASEL